MTYNLFINTNHTLLPYLDVCVCVCKLVVFFNVHSINKRIDINACSIIILCSWQINYELN